MQRRRILTSIAALTTFLLPLSSAFLPNAASARLQTQETKPANELKGPIIALIIASSIDAKGNINNSKFSFLPDEPQITAIVYVGEIGESQLNVTWFKTSDNGDEKLFEHHIQVKSNERAFSVAKNPTRNFELGTYKVIATLGGQTEEAEFDISPPKQQNKAASPQDDQLFERLAHASSRTVEIIQVRSASVTPKRPVAGSSGTAPQPTSPVGPSGSACQVFVLGLPLEANNTSPQANEVKISSYAVCPTGHRDAQGNLPNFFVDAFDKGPGFAVLGQYNAGEVIPKGAAFQLDPCVLSGGSDLPGTKITVKAIQAEPYNSLSATQIITLGDDSLAPRVNVISTPSRTSPLKAGQTVSLHVTVQERRKNGPWQTGIKMIQVTAIPGGQVGEPWVNPASLPKSCSEKTWEHTYEATYTVPDNPPPTIRICAIAEDYIGNESAQCGDFHAEPKNVMPANCRSKGYAKVDMLDGAPVDGSFDPASPNYNMISCNFRWSICGKAFIKSKVVKNESGVCDAFFDSEKANLTKEQFCCDCYPRCRK